VPSDAVFQLLGVYPLFVKDAPEFSETVVPVFPVVLVIVPVPRLLLYVIVCDVGAQTAYSVVFAAIANVEDIARDVPETLAHVAPAAGCAVHHPLKL
jgi:hypothetical protein